MSGNTKLGGLPEDQDLIERLWKDDLGQFLYDDGELDRMFAALLALPSEKPGTGYGLRSKYNLTNLTCRNLRSEEYGPSTHGELWFDPIEIAAPAERLADAVERGDPICQEFLDIYAPRPMADDLERDQVVRYFRGLAEHARKVAAAGVKLVTIDTAS